MNLLFKSPHIGWVFLLVLLLAGSIYFRFSEWDSHTLNRDEVYYIVAAIKLNSPHKTYDAREYNYEHPFLGKKIMGMGIDSNQSYYNTSIIPADLYVYNYLGAHEYRDQIPSMRFMTALFGLLALIPAFLIGRTLFSTRAGLLTAALVGLSIGFINQSRILYQDAFLPFFFFMTIWSFLEWIKSNPHEKWNGVSFSWGWLILTLIFLTLSGLVRLGQPSILAVGILIVVFMLKKPILPWIIGIVSTAVAVFWLYFPEALHSYWTSRQADAFMPGLYPQFILSYLSLQSLAFLGAVLVLLWYVFTRAKFDPRSFLKSRWEKAHVHLRAAIILFIFFTL
ncbi:MAG: phospholipid carrier-dependent glycosyltransferase, partial [archaeon]